MTRTGAVVTRMLAQHGGLVNQGDMSRMWGVSRTRVTQMADTPSFPAPVGWVGGKRVWLMEDVQQWRRGVR